MNIVDFRVLMVDENLDTIKAQQWREMTVEQRAEFINNQLRKGFASFGCVRCGYPTHHGQSTCEACE